MAKKSKDTKGIRVFVYGTLKSGHCNHAALEGADFLGRCYIEGKYTMLDLGWYPAVVGDEGSEKGKIFGEVYRVNSEILFSLDLIEGHPRYYARSKIETPWKQAWCYFLPPTFADKEYAVVKNGMWRPTKEEKEFARGTK